MADVRDLLSWSQQGGLARALQVSGSKLRADPDRVMAMGTSAGGHLALSLVRKFDIIHSSSHSLRSLWQAFANVVIKAWDVPKPPLAILDFYGAKCFEDDFWSRPVAQIKGILPPKPPPAFFEPLFAEKETFTGGVSLEGQAGPAAQGPDFTDPRQAYALYNIGEGKMLQSIWPHAPTDLHLVDPYLNIDPSWPPTVIVHGNRDFMIPIHISKKFEARLKENNVESALIEVEGEPHTFVGKMEKGSQTWVTQRQGFDFLDDVLSRSYKE